VVGCEEESREVNQFNGSKGEGPRGLNAMWPFLLMISLGEGNTNMVLKDIDN
jgi:hypothetical protein